MSSSYCVTYGGDRITFGGTPGPVAWEYVPPPVRRYEYTLYHNSGRVGVSAGTLNSSISGFDELMVGVGWPNSYNQFGIQWKTFDMPSAHNDFNLQTIFAGSAANSWYFMLEAFMTINTASNTFAVSANTANRWMVQTQSNTTATWVTANTANGVNRLKCVTDIVGVKYR